MNLFEIDAAIETTMTQAMDPETGEILDDVLWDKLNGLDVARNTKVENIACWIKDLAAEDKALKDEEDSFKKRRKAAKNKAESLKKYLKAYLDGRTFKSTRCAISYRKSEAVEIDDADKLPEGYKKVSYTPDKTKIKAALKAGKDVSGAKLVKNSNMQIK